MGWVGIIGLVTCGAILPVERAFPGCLALWPVISGGALVVMAGRTSSRWGHRSTAGLRTPAAEPQQHLLRPVPGALAHPRPL